MAKIDRSATHGDKLRALLANDKLPAPDKERVEDALGKYATWRNELETAQGTPDEVLTAHIDALNRYKRYIELDLIFSAEGDFLYRQNGQLKLANSILEEFLPFLFDERLVPGLARISTLMCGPRSSFSGMSFDAPYVALATGGVQIKLKDQDFAVCRPFKLTVSENGGKDSFTTNISVSYFAAEIKTNLDKTMFQEASQTAAELKRAVPGAKYLLLCEYLDMTPISTRLTAIDEVVILRKAKRMASNKRNTSGSSTGRKAAYDEYAAWLDRNPLSQDCFKRVVDHLKECFPTREDSENTVLSNGYF